MFSFSQINSFYKIRTTYNQMLRYGYNFIFGGSCLESAAISNHDVSVIFFTLLSMSAHVKTPL
jgi:hypothetical protein